RKAENCVVLNMQNLTPITDYYVICHGTNERQVQAIARAVKEKMSQTSTIEVQRMEGFEEARWILIDLGYVICHVFHKEDRAFYNLERLWGDAEQISMEGE